MANERSFVRDFFVVVASIIGFPGVSHVAFAAETYVIRAKKVYTVTGGVVENGTVVVQDGKIVAVGSDVAPPAGARELTVYAVMPGLIDIHSHITAAFPVELGEDAKASPVTPQVRAMDSFDYKNPQIESARAGGVTTIVLRPGSGNVIGGASVAIKLKDTTPDRMIIKEPVDIKMSLETFLGKSLQGKWSVPGFPHPNSTQESFRAVASEAFRQAQEYESRWQAYERERKAGNAVTPPQRDLGFETLLKALKREIPVHFHCFGEPEGSPMECVKLADTFGLEISLGHAALAALHLGQLGSRKDIHFNVGPALFVADKSDPTQFMNAAAILANAGLKVSLQTDAPVFPQQSLRDMATLIVRYGMKEEDALKAVTLRGAQAMGLDDRIGSLEPGKDADLVLLDGEPFEFATSIEKVLIDGKIEYERAAAAAGVTQLPAEWPTGRIRLPARFERADRFAIRAGTILTMAGAPIRNGTILVSHGRIEKIGRDMDVPASIPLIDARDFFVMPGLVSARSQAGLSSEFQGMKLSGEDFSKAADSVAPERDIQLEVDPQDPLFVIARMLGVTAALVTPSDKHVMGGQGLALKMAGSTPERALLRRQAAAIFNLGEAAKRPGEMPSTRMGIVAVLRQTFIDARAYRDKIAASAAAGSAGFAKDAAMEALLPVLDGRMPAMFHCDREADVWTALIIADEFNLKLIVTGAMNISPATAAELAARRVPVVLELDSDGSESPAVLARAGVVVAFRRADGFYRRTNDGIWQVSHPAGALGGDLLEIAARAYRSGMSEEAALRAITMDAAKIMGVDQRVGSLEVGKDADILILAGHPLRVRSVPELVLIDGKPVYQRKEGAWTTPPK